jgi:hypothetical protein
LTTPSRTPQHRLVEALQIDRSSLFQIPAADGELIFTHSWSGPDLPKVPFRRGTSVSHFPWSISQTMKGELVTFSSLSEVPHYVPDRLSYEEAGVRSIVIVPLMVSGRVIGSLAFTATREERVWEPAIVNRLRLVAQVFASALARKRADIELRKASDDRMRFETLVSEIASQFVNLDVNQIDGAIQTSQGRIVDALDLDRGSLFQRSDDGEHFVLTHSWSRPEIPALPIELGTVLDLFPTMSARILRGERICLSSPSELPANSRDRQDVERFGIKSTVAVPLIVSAGSSGRCRSAPFVRPGSGCRRSSTAWSWWGRFSRGRSRGNAARWSCVRPSKRTRGCVNG